MNISIINRIKYFQPFCNSLNPPYKRLLFIGYNNQINYKWGIKAHFISIFRFNHYLDYLEVICWLVLIQALIL